MEQRTHRVIVTTSWDDGHRLDMRLASMLDRYGVGGTFYIAPDNREIAPEDRLTRADMSDLASSFEVGGHTLRHWPLPRLTAPLAIGEMRAGKSELEDVIGRPVTSFCYPDGAYRPEHVAMAAEVGFKVARTVRRGATSPGAALEMATTAHAYQHLRDGVTALRLAGGGLQKATRYFLEWDEMAMGWFDLCLARGGVFHLWGHSWEIDARRDWGRLERVLEYIAGRPDVDYATNGEVPALVGVSS